MIIKSVTLDNYCQHKARTVDVQGNLIAVIGHNGCLAEGTPVRMFDGTIKPVEQIKAGDVLLAFDDKTGRLTSSTVCDMIRTEPNHKPKPMLEVEINGEKTCTTYDHPFFAGDGFYPLYQLAWGALEAGQRSRLKLLCEQYGAPFDDATVWQQNSCCDEAVTRRGWVLQDHAGWAYREGPSDRGGELAGEPAWSPSCEPYRLQQGEQQGGKPGVVHAEVQCVVWGNPWQYRSAEAASADCGGTRPRASAMGGEEGGVPVQGARRDAEGGSCGHNQGGDSSRSGNVDAEHRTGGMRIEVLEAAPYYTIGMRAAPYTYCIGRRNCYLTHNCGKSNFLGAIQFALTGEQPGKTKDSLVHWGAKDGKVTLEFEMDGKPGRIVRPIVSPKVVLEYDGQEVIGITAVAKALEERLNIDKDLVKQSVFVRQKEIDTIISAKTDKRDREVAFQKLLGLDAARIHKNLTDWMYGAVKPINYDIQITEAAQRLGELEARETTLAGEVKAADEAVAKEGPLTGDTTDLQKSMAAIGAVLAAQSQRKVCRDDDAKARAALESVKAGLGDVGENPGVDIAEKAQENQILTDEIAKADALVRAQGVVDEWTGKLKALEEEAAALATKPHPTDAEIQKLETDIQVYQESLAAKNAELAAHQKALGALNGGETACPVCGKPLDRDTVAKLQQELVALRIEVAGLGTLIDGKKGQRAQLRSSKEAWDSRNAKVTANVGTVRTYLEKAQSDLAALPQPAVDRETAQKAIAENNALIQRQKDYDAKVAGNAKVVKEAEVRANVCADAVTNAETRLAETTIEAIRLCGEEAEADWSAAQQALQGAVAEYNAKRDRIQALQLAATKAKATHDEVVKSLATLRQTVEALKEQQKQQDVLAKRLATLEKVRDWFHYANGPRVLVKQVIDAITDDVNKFLGNFTAPFIVTPNDEDLGFIVEFTDGRDRPEKPQTTEVLSGGELVQLAVAFRFAVYQMFAGKLGLLSLDEPMAFLDANNIGRFGVFLMKVREITKNMNIQVFIATHQQVVIPHMDSIIDLN